MRGSERTAEPELVLEDGIDGVLLHAVCRDRPLDGKQVRVFTQGQQVFSLGTLHEPVDRLERFWQAFPALRWHPGAD